MPRLAGIVIGKDSLVWIRKTEHRAQCRVIGGSGRMDALSDYICKSNELVDKMVRILLYIQRTGIRKGSKDQDLGTGGQDGVKKGKKGAKKTDEKRDIGRTNLPCLEKRLKRA